MKINYIIFSIIFLLIVLIVFLNITKEKEIIKTLESNITVKLYTNKKENEIIKKINKITDSDLLSSTLEKEGITKYIFNNNGNISAGNYYKKGKYSVSLIYKENLLEIIKLKNECLYIKSEDDFYIAVIDKTMKNAKKTLDNYLKTNKLDENKKIYVFKDDEKKFTKKFEKHIK